MITGKERRELEVMKAIGKQNTTKSETRIMELLSEAGIRYIFKKGFFNETNPVVVDFYLPKPNRVCILVDKNNSNDVFLNSRKHFKVIHVNDIEQIDFKTMLSQ